MTSTAKSTAKELDQFYTNPKVAERFVERIDEYYGFDNFDHVIEPSMGEGFIYDLLPPDKRIGLDLEKNHPDCLEGDFLEWVPEKNGIRWEPLRGHRPDIIFVGNPPFGSSSQLAMEFFNRCSYFSDVICSSSHDHGVDTAHRKDFPKTSDSSGKRYCLTTHSSSTGNLMQSDAWHSAGVDTTLDQNWKEHILRTGPRWNYEHELQSERHLPC